MYLVVLLGAFGHLAFKWTRNVALIQIVCQTTISISSLNRQLRVYLALNQDFLYVFSLLTLPLFTEQTRVPKCNDNSHMDASRSSEPSGDRRIDADKEIHALVWKPW